MGAKSIKEVSGKFLKMCGIYHRFANGFTQHHTFTEVQKLELYNQETFGIKIQDDNKNGYLLGKKLMDINIAMWREDIARGHLSRKDLYEDFPAWWLDKVLFNITSDMFYKFNK